jgi:hypothetical protein
MGRRMAQKLSPAAARLTLVGFCLTFISVGLGIWIPWFLLPTLEWNRMRSWTPTPCTVVRTEHRLETGFRYVWDDQVHESRNLGPEGLFGSQGFRLLELPDGAPLTCYVNPRDPTEAALSRSFDPELFFGCAPLIFVVLPLLALILGWRQIGQPAAPEPDALPPLKEGARILEPVSRGGCGCLLASVLCFGGLTGGLIAIPSSRGSLLGWFYAVPLGFATLALLRIGVYKFLASFNPTVVLTLTPGQGVPGRTLELRWEARGNLARVKSFRIELEAREEAKVGKSRTRSEPFLSQELFKSGSKDLRRGLVKLKLPAGLMHTLEHGAHRIVWAIKVHADAPRWPRGGEEYVFEVLPGNVA